MAESIQQLTSISPSQPGNLQNVWSKTNGQLYHKLSPYDDSSNSSLINFGSKSPFNYTYPDKTNAFLNGKYDSFSFPFAASINDTIRVSKFIVSGNGVLFIAKQLLLNSGNAFNETRIFSPTEVLVSAARPGLLGLTSRVTRHIDISGGGLMGILGSLVGIGSENSNQPSGTVVGEGPFFNRVPGDNDGEHISTPYRGLSRAGTANKGLARLNTKWNIPNKSAGFFGSIFSNFIPAKQDGVLYKSGEDSYGKMITNDSPRLWSIAGDGTIVKTTQQWVAGEFGIRKNKEYPYEAGRMFVNSLGRPYSILNSDLAKLPDITGVGKVGYDIDKNSKSRKSYKYGDNIGVKPNEEYQSSDIMVQYQNYVDPKTEYKSKKIDKKSIEECDNILKHVLVNIANSYDGLLYDVKWPAESRIINISPDLTPTNNGYNRLFKTVNGPTRDASGIQIISPNQYPLGVLASYRANVNFSPVDDSTANSTGQSKRIPTSNLYDAINTLTVITKNISDTNTFVNMQGWNNTKWEPYKHDQVAFYFYDIVNQNYIPFRASITGISEGGGAEWEALSFIGRADKVYSYSGFTRTLSFKFTVHISSIAELAPTWQRINYLSTLIKPSNYTSDNAGYYTGGTSGIAGGASPVDIMATPPASTTALPDKKHRTTNRFMIPPMVMLNVGDMYRDQPVVITQVGTSIPEDASWETLNEDNSDVWSYLSDYIKAPGMKYGQLPRSVDITMTMNLLEKEQPIAGGANFGHAPRNNIFKSNDWNTNTPDNSKITDFNKSLVVDVNK